MRAQEDSGPTLGQMLVVMVCVLAATAGLTTKRGSHVLLRAAPHVYTQPAEAPPAKLGQLATPADDEYDGELDILDKGMRGHNSNFGWMPEDPRCRTGLAQGSRSKPTIFNSRYHDGQSKR